MGLLSGSGIELAVGQRLASSTELTNSLRIGPVSGMDMDDSTCAWSGGDSHVAFEHVFQGS